MKLPPFRLERYFARFEFEVPYLLGSSDCEPMTLRELLLLEPDIEERLAQLHLSYCETRGGPELRQAIADLYLELGADDVLVHGAAIEALFVLMNVALETGDRVVVQTPCFQPLAEIARSIGCTVVAWRCEPGDGWRPDLGELQELLKTPTRLLVLNFPHNPTGFLPNHDEFRETLRLAREREVLVFCDEIFRFLEHDVERRLPAACEIDDRAVSLGGLSKVFGLPGLRTGWLASRNRPLLERMLNFKDYTSTCGPAISELLAALALRHREGIIDRNRARVLRNLKLFSDFVTRNKSLIEWVPPGAGTVAFPRLNVGEDLLPFCDLVAETAGVLLIPGATFDMPDHVRVGFGRAHFEEGLTRLEESVRNISRGQEIVSG